jgi:hypothetical protein
MLCIMQPFDDFALLDMERLMWREDVSLGIATRKLVEPTDS